jgi:cyclophilin family peptidyl-prolyl cis-trans isomerase/HEAT repeat protein
MLNVPLVLLILVVSVPLQAQPLSTEEREILMLQDQRSLGMGKLVSYLTHEQERLRYRAAIALANLQDTSTVRPLVQALSDEAPQVRAAAAFALGQIGVPFAEQGLKSRLATESHPDVLIQTLEALGRCGTEEGLSAIVEFEPKSDEPRVARGIATGIARFALRGIKNERSIWRCFEFASHANPDISSRALFALWRAAPSRIIDIEIARREDDLSLLTRHPDPDVRLNLAILLGRSSVPEAVALLNIAHGAEQTLADWRVKVSLVRALAAQVPTHPELLNTLKHELMASNDHVIIACLQALVPLHAQVSAEPSLREELERTLLSLVTDGTKPEILRGEAIVCLGKFSPTRIPTALLDDSEAGTRLKSKVLEALSLSPSPDRYSILLNHLSHDSVRIAMAAWDFIRRLTTPAYVAAFETTDTTLGNVRARLMDGMREALARRDMAITTLVAMTVADSGVVSLYRGTEFREAIADELTGALRSLRSPDDTEAMQAVIDALGRIGDERAVPVLETSLDDPDRTVAQAASSALFRLTRQDYSHRIPRASTPTYTDYDWTALENLSPSASLVIKTTRGEFRMRLFKEHAPFTVLNIVKLTRKGFYNGLSFHRVVPNFVIQGGDPRGDGWGGPGYAIRSEFSLVNYGRGTAGIASAGKDTEGCQFFVTHSSQPHLDGRYTIFAEVIHGMDVVDAVQVGDKIVSMRVDE